jgi:FdhD protein
VNPTAPPHSVQSVRVEAIRGNAREPRMDDVAAEEPLEVRLRHGRDRRETTLGILMRTPGHDEELAAGLLLSEGIVRRREDLRGFQFGRDRDGHPDPNLLIAELDASVPFEPAAHARATVQTSACGVCGRASLDTLFARRPPTIDRHGPVIHDEVLRGLPDQLRAAQAVFAATGGLHAAGLSTRDGTLEAVREDVGRHNAVDKLLGRALLDGRLPAADRILVVSGRAGYEILQKAAMSGVPLVAAIGAPSSLAVELAEEAGITLVGFLRPDAYNVYAHGHRVAETKRVP